MYAEITRFDAATDVKGPAEDGIYAHSIYLHNGAVWNKRESKLSDISFSALGIARGAGNMSSLLPVLYFGALPRHLLKREDNPTFDCPLYAFRVPKALPICLIFIKQVMNPTFHFYFIHIMDTKIVLCVQDEAKLKWNLRGVHASCHKE